MSLFFVISQFKLARWGVEYSSLSCSANSCRRQLPAAHSIGRVVCSVVEGEGELYPARKEIAGLEGFPVSSLTDWAQDKTENVRP
jgi:hypothetical protein